MDVELVSIGDELLLGYTIDTNAAFFARQAAALGIRHFIYSAVNVY